MFKIFSLTISILIFLLLVVVLFGLLSDPNYKIVLSALYDDKIDRVWQVLTEVEKYPETKKDVIQLEILEKNFNSITKWREIVSNKRSREYEMLEKNNQNKFVLKMKDSLTGLEGIWTYTLIQENKETELKISEESVVNNLLWRGILKIIGREYFINKEFKWLRVNLFQKLLLS